MSRRRKYYWLISVVLLVLTQLLLAYSLMQHPNVMPFPPLRLSLVVGAQLVISLALATQLDITRKASQAYLTLLVVLYCSSLFFLYGPLAPSFAGVKLRDPTIGTEALISIVLLIGFAIMNIVHFIRLAKR